MSKATTNNINLNISIKQDYTINGNPNLVIKLNPGDMHIITRLNEIIPQLNELETKYQELFNAEPDENDVDTTLATFSTGFKELDNRTRELVNYLFDYDVCGVCANGGSMFDLQDGEYRFSVIINTLMTLYEETITEETQKMLNKMKKRVEKYTNRDHKSKGSK